jgi:hypothetical protein
MLGVVQSSDDGCASLMQKYGTRVLLRNFFLFEIGADFKGYDVLVRAAIKSLFTTF